MLGGLGLRGHGRSTSNKGEKSTSKVAGSPTPSSSSNNATTFDRRGRIRQRTHPASAVVDEESGSGAVDQSPDSKRRPRRNHAVRRSVFAILHFVEGEHWQKASTWYQSHKRLVVCIILAIPFILRPSRAWRWRYLYFGHHNIQGGQIGQYIEKRGYIARYNEVQAKQKKLLDSLGIVMPPAIPPDEYFRVLNFDTQAALREMLVRREQRSKLLSTLEKQAAMTSCNRQPHKANKGDIDDSSCRIPPIIFVPSDISGWYPPRPGKSKLFSKASFNEIEMRQFIMDATPQLTPLYDSFSDIQLKIHVWAVVSVYYLGGVFVGSLSGATEDLLDSLLWRPDNIISSHDKNHSAPLALAALQKTQDGQILDLLVATPKHPALLCAIKQWEHQQSEAFGVFPFIDLDGNKWRHGLHPTSGEDCKLNLREVDKLEIDTVSDQVGAEVFVQQRTAGYVKDSLSDVTTTIHETNPPAPLPKSEKVPLESLLQAKKAEPGWMCMRCIKLPQYGQFEKCEKYCSSKDYIDIVCRGDYVPRKAPVPVQVSFSGLAKSYTAGSAIPKIIHQTWFEEITPDRYPQVTRLQNSWKNSGWDYRLYTDESARQYIAKHFPPRFVDAFDAIIPGAYKADLFRYLVLMREGGVYSDIDILLETNLDNFLTPSLTFFAPRDVPLEFAGEPYCLWNGLIGAAPGRKSTESLPTPSCSGSLDVHYFFLSQIHSLFVQ